MKAVILAGGLGTRISEETTIKPKPMVEIGGMPILWHIMNIFATQGSFEFVVALGYKGDVIQKWLKELKNRGIILAVCSKNNEDVAKEAFLRNTEMVLKLDDISVFVANWNNKADNIRSIQSTLNIGYNSMVFLDDNPVERQIVKDNIPDITVPELPEDPAYYLQYLYLHQSYRLYHQFQLF